MHNPENLSLKQMKTSLLNLSKELASYITYWPNICKFALSTLKHEIPETHYTLLFFGSPIFLQGR